MASKLLLIEDVEDLGRSGDVVTVRPGFARNFLLPRGLAVVADKGAIRMQARLQEQRRQKAAEDKKEAESLAAQLSDITLTKVVKVDHEGHMYGSVTAQDIIHLVHDQAKISLEKRSLQVKQPFKEIGVHKVNVKLKEGVTTSFTLKIISEADKESSEAEAAQ